MKRIISLDIETTGLYPKKGDKIVEIGCVEIVNNQITDNNFHIYINPGIPMPEAAFKIHGLSTDFLKDFLSFDQIVDGLLEFIGNSHIIAHNARFDIGFLNYELSLIGKSEISYDRVTDTLYLARNKFPKQKVSLDSLCERYNVSLSERVKHSAIIDAKLLAKIYPNLVETKQLGMILESVKNTRTEIDYNCDLYYPISEENMQLNNSLVNKIKDPIWNHFKV